MRLFFSGEIFSTKAQAGALKVFACGTTWEQLRRCLVGRFLDCEIAGFADCLKPSAKTGCRLFCCWFGLTLYFLELSFVCIVGLESAYRSQAFDSTRHCLI